MYSQKNKGLTFTFNLIIFTFLSILYSYLNPFICFYTKQIIITTQKRFKIESKTFITKFQSSLVVNLGNLIVKKNQYQLQIKFQVPSNFFEVPSEKIEVCFPKKRA